jgi:hypothetical protein
MEDKSCTKSPFFEIPGDKMRISPIEAEPIEGYEVPADFPNCCPHHKQAFANAQNWFDKFPNCCERHIEAAKKWHLKKSEFDGLPQKILNGLSFTEHHISKRIDIPEWYEDITNYIDYICWCFGHPAIGDDRYIMLLKHYLTATTANIPKQKRERLLQYIESENKPSNPDEASKFDLNILYDTYQKWLKTFPFELPYFDGLKERLKGAIPVLKEPKKQNPYTGMWKAKGITQAELIDFLAVTTKRLIGEVQMPEIQNSDMKQHRLKIENERLRVGTDELVKGYSKGELKYVTTIKKWLELQKQYFKAVVEITKDAKTAEKGKPKSNEELPTLENALVSPERLRPLFVWLKKKQGNKEWFDDSGYIGSDERNASILLGFAEGMKMARQMKPHLSEKQLYHILCRHYNLKPTPEPHKVRKGYNFKEVKKLVMEFFRLE